VLRPWPGGRKITTSCLIVFVAVDGGGDTVPVPAWLPETEEEKRLEQYAKHMAKVRKEQDKEMSLGASSEC
jgi:acyl-CoA hydrolase